MDKRVEEMVAWVVENIEKPNPIFAGLPPCPFARRARLDGKLRYEIGPLNRENIMKGIEEFLGQDYEAIIFVHPDKNLTCEYLRGLTAEVNKEVEKHKLLGFFGHPEEPFNIAGYHTRRDPYPNIQVIRHQLVEQARMGIVNTGYYDKFTPENLRDIEYTPPPRSRRSRNPPTSSGASGA